jgi:hypothetical protein
MRGLIPAKEITMSMLFFLVWLQLGGSFGSSLGCGIGEETFTASAPTYQLITRTAYLQLKIVIT